MREKGKETSFVVDWEAVEVPNQKAPIGRGIIIDINRRPFQISSMALTYSKMLELGIVAPDFSLPDTTGKVVSLADFKSAPALLVMFICNHCPYVRHVAQAIAQLAREYQSKG